MASTRFGVDWIKIGIDCTSLLFGSVVLVDSTSLGNRFVALVQLDGTQVVPGSVDIPY